MIYYETVELPTFLILTDVCGIKISEVYFSVRGEILRFSTNNVIDFVMNLTASTSDGLRANIM